MINILKNFLPLLRARLLMAINSLFTVTLKDIPKLLFFSSIALVFILFDYFFFFRVTTYIFNLEDGVGNILLVELWRIIFISFFSMVLFSSLIISVSNLYLSSDIGYLKTLPLSRLSIYLIKTLQSLIQSVWMPLLFGIPIFFAFGNVYGLEPAFYASSIIYFLLLLLTASSMGNSLSQVIVKYFRPEKIYQLCSFLAAFLVVSLLLMFRAMEPEKLIGNVPDEMVVDFFEQLKIPGYAFLPSTWGATLIRHSIDGFFTPVGNILLLSSLTALFFILLSTVVAFFSYEKSLFETAGRIIKKRGKSVKYFLNSGSGKRSSSLFIELWRKEIKMFVRDPSQWTQVLLLGALLLIYLFNIYKLPLNNYYLKNFIAFVNMGMAGFVLAALCARFVYPSISMEGRSIWLIRSLPLDAGKYIMSKYYFYFFPLLFFALFITYFSNTLLNASPFIMFMSLCTTVIITAVIVAVSILCGVLFPKFSHENIVQVSASYGGIVLMIVSFCYIGAVIVIEAYPVYAYFQREIFLRDMGNTGVYMSYFAIFTISILLLTVSLYKAVKTMKRKEFLA